VSPGKQQQSNNTVILKKDMLEKARLSLQQKANVAGLQSMDLKRIQENLVSRIQASQRVQSAGQAAMSESGKISVPPGNIINNNNINNFFIQNASVIEMLTKNAE
jgi:hypothetical protein